MTPTVQQLQLPLTRDLRPWLVKVNELVQAKVADAAAHAGRAITKKLKEERDGRPTLRQATAHPSFSAALARLAELKAALVGPSTDSLKGLLRDARADFFTRSFDLWRSNLDPEFYRVDAIPTKAGIDVARGAVINGYSPDAEIEGVFSEAVRTLKVAVAISGSRLAEPSRAGDILDAWEETTRRKVAKRCADSLGDAQWALFWAVEQVMAKEEFR